MSGQEMSGFFVLVKLGTIVIMILSYEPLISLQAQTYSNHDPQYLIQILMWFVVLIWIFTWLVVQNTAQYSTVYAQLTKGRLLRIIP